MKKMKILIWSPYINLGGGIRLLFKLSDAISRHPDVELVRLAVPQGYIEDNGICTNKRLEILELPQSWLETNSRILGVKSTIRLKTLLLRLFPGVLVKRRQKQFKKAVNGCDLSYCYWPHRQTYPITNKPMVCTYQDATLLEFPEILGGKETNAEWQRSKVWVENSTSIVVSSTSTKEKLVKHFGKCCEKASIIHHAILPAKDGTLNSKKSKLLDHLPAQYIVFPANITTHKNHYNLLIAWSRFKYRKEFPLVLFGDGIQELNLSIPNMPDSWQVAKLIGGINRIGLKLGEDIYALGYVDDSDVISLISNAKALIMPTLAEGGGSFPVEEALSFGVPVLCSNISVMREHLSYRTAKICWFDPDCPSAIVNALETFIDNYSEYKQSAISSMSDSRPSWNDISSQYVKVFHETLNQ